ncbi:C39 family peptidase [Secundilactobacillus paracollinoides]|uniref:C39 family peptidase n=1 Tax=Secundilactobacillus paracollinoides TaxID=240427 RepID=UPI0009E72EEB|nr:C39 family peptidase [Secundilactobacillus paracollinoides]
MKLSQFILGTALGLAAGAVAFYYKKNTDVLAPERLSNTRIFDDFSAVDLQRFGKQLSYAAADNSALVLEQHDDAYVAEGILLTPAFKLTSFKTLVVSWNALTPRGTSVDVSAQVLVDGEWSKWHSWGHWSASQPSASAVEDTIDPLASLDTDTLTTSGTATEVRLRVKLHSDDATQTPVLKLLAASVKPLNRDLTADDHPIELDKVISAPAYSQEIRDPKLAPGICSPTTVSMAVNRQNADILPEEAALRNYDETYDGFGNWSFSTALAGSLGYHAYTAFTTMNGLRHLIADGYPVGVSVQYTNDPNQTDLPYVKGTPGSTYGHLLLVTGFTKIDGVDYVAVNDSYADDDATAKRFYRLDQFSKAWASRVAYIIEENYPGYERLMQPSRITVTLLPDDDLQHYTVCENDNLRPLTPTQYEKTSHFDEETMTVAYCFNDDGNKASLANQHIYYADVDDQGRIILDVKALKLKHPAATELTVYVARLAAPTLTATINLDEIHAD